jgi:hypothetical protein
VEEEYERYFEFMASKGLITNTIEHLELEELPGATGLKALRIEIISQGGDRKDDLLRDIHEALRLH